MTKKERNYLAEHKVYQTLNCGCDNVLFVRASNLVMNRDGVMWEWRMVSLKKRFGKFHLKKHPKNTTFWDYKSQFTLVTKDYVEIKRINELETLAKERYIRDIEMEYILQTLTDEEKFEYDELKESLK